MHGNAYSQEYAIMTTNGLLVEVSVETQATTYGGVDGHNIEVVATRNTSIVGGNSVDYKFTRTLLQ